MSKESDVEEVRLIFKAITEFLQSIREPIKDLINTLMSSLEGSKLGEDVGTFYKKLIDSGIPEELAESMTKDYLKHKLESALGPKAISNLLRGFTGSTKSMVSIATKIKDIDTTSFIVF